MLYVRLPDDGNPNKHNMTVIAVMCGVDLQNNLSLEGENFLNISKYQISI